MLFNKNKYIRSLLKVIFSHHCKRMFPVLETVGEYYDGKMLTVAKIDTTRQKPTIIFVDCKMLILKIKFRFAKAGEHFNITGYPTIKL